MRYLIVAIFFFSFVSLSQAQEPPIDDGSGGDLPLDNTTVTPGPTPVTQGEERITITTYYPSPYGNYRELRAKRVAIGDNYIEGGQYCWEGTCANTIDPEADLIVEGSVGIGIFSPTTSTRLHIHNSATGQGIRGLFLTTLDSGTTLNDGLELGLDASQNGYVWLRENKDLALATNATPYLTLRNNGDLAIYNDNVLPLKPMLGRLDLRSYNNARLFNIMNNGNVGIATESQPQARLEIYQGQANPALRIRSGENDADNYHLEIAPVNPSAGNINYEFRLKDWDTSAPGQHVTYDKAMVFSGQEGTIGIGNDPYVNPDDPNIKTQLFIQSENNIGLGIYNPDDEATIWLAGHDGDSGDIDIIKSGLYFTGDVFSFVSGGEAYYPKPRPTNSWGIVYIGGNLGVGNPMNNALVFARSNPSGEGYHYDFINLMVDDNNPEIHTVGIGDPNYTDRNYALSVRGRSVGLTQDHRAVYVRGNSEMVVDIDDTPSQNNPTLWLYSLNSPPYQKAILRIDGEVWAAENHNLPPERIWPPPSSDIKFKKEIVPVNNALEKVLKMRGVSFVWKTAEYPQEGFSRGKHYGLIAQELERIIPELVRENSKKERSINYTELIPILIEAIKEQQKEIEDLRKRLP